MRTSSILVSGAVAAVAVAGSVTASNVIIDGGTNWTGWNLLGNSQAAGIYQNYSTTNNFDIFTTSFYLPSTNPVVGSPTGNTAAQMTSGSFQTGDLIVGVGIRWNGGQRGTGWDAAKFDRNGTGSFTAAVGATPGNENEFLHGGTGMLSFARAPFGNPADSRGSIYEWWMRDPSSANATGTGPGNSGTYQPNGSNFYNNNNNFWGQTFASLDANKDALPFRTYGVVDANGFLSYQYLINSSAFDRAGSIYSSLDQSFLASQANGGWNFSLWVNRTGPGQWFETSTSVVGLNVGLVPAPGAIALLGAAGLVGSRRRRN